MREKKKKKCCYTHLLLVIWYCISHFNFGVSLTRSSIISRLSLTLGEYRSDPDKM